MTTATARAIARDIERNIRRFDRACKSNEHTDTGQAWELLYDCIDRARRIQNVLKPGRKPWAKGRQTGPRHHGSGKFKRAVSTTLSAARRV